MFGIGPPAPATATAEPSIEVNLEGASLDIADWTKTIADMKGTNEKPKSEAVKKPVGDKADNDDDDDGGCRRRRRRRRR